MSTQRMHYAQHAPDLLRKLTALGEGMRATGFDPKILDLVYLRSSQINGCLFCLDMHTKEAAMKGIGERKLAHLAIWEESSLFSEREKAALEWTEILTRLSESEVSDELYRRMLDHLTEKELVELTFAIGMIGAWNRLGVAFRVEPGSADQVLHLDRAKLRE